MAKKLEETTRIRIDMDRINDFESLDTSFVEGRAKRKIDKKESLKKEILSDKKNPSILSIFTMVLFIIIILGILLFLFLIFIHNQNFKQNFLIQYLSTIHSIWR